MFVFLLKSTSLKKRVANFDALQTYWIRQGSISISGSTKADCKGIGEMTTCYCKKRPITSGGAQGAALLTHVMLQQQRKLKNRYKLKRMGLPTLRVFRHFPKKFVLAIFVVCPPRREEEITSRTSSLKVEHKLCYIFFGWSLCIQILTALLAPLRRSSQMNKTAPK